MMGVESGKAVTESASTKPEWTEPEWLEPEWMEPKWKILSLLLSYPGYADFTDMLSEAEQWATEIGATGLAQVTTRLRSLDIQSLVSEYVQRFDFQSKTCLYLTAHELGDSRKRGLALVALRRMLADAGLYERSLTESEADAASQQTELPDYIPLLFEFLAAKPSDFDSRDLETRLSRVCQAIYEALSADSVYQAVFKEALDLLPSITLQPNGFPFASDAKPDLEDLPYPVFYD